jgi:ATP synthase protein I
MTQPEQIPPDALAELGNKIAQAEATSQGKNNLIAQVNRESGLAWRVMVEIAAGPTLGLWLGYWLDRQFGTSPLWVLALFFIGLAAGFLNAYKSATKKNRAVGFQASSTTKE